MPPLVVLLYILQKHLLQIQLSHSGPPAGVFSKNLIPESRPRKVTDQSTTEAIHRRRRRYAQSRMEEDAGGGRGGGMGRLAERTGKDAPDPRRSTDRTRSADTTFERSRSTAPRLRPARLHLRNRGSSPLHCRGYRSAALLPPPPSKRQRSW